MRNLRPHPFELLAEPVRRRVVEVLASGEHSAGELADAVGHEFGISASAVSHHLRILRDARFVKVRYEGASRIYRLSKRALPRLDAAVGELYALWNRRIGWPWNRDPLAIPEHRPSRKGNRGRGYRNNPWNPEVPPR
jgi:DNA-binding transcriptional ArsR family regulator